MTDLRKRDKFCCFPRINWEIYFRHIKINLAGCTICFSCWLTLPWIWFLSHIPNFTCKLFYSYPLFSTIPSMLTFYSEFHSHSSTYKAINTNDFLVPTPLEFSQGFLLLLFLGIFTDYGNSERLLQGKIFCFDSVLCLFYPSISFFFIISYVTSPKVLSLKFSLWLFYILFPFNHHSKLHCHDSLVYIILFFSLQLNICLSDILLRCLIQIITSIEWKPSTASSLLTPASYNQANSPNDAPNLINEIIIITHIQSPEHTLVYQFHVFFFFSCILYYQLSICLSFNQKSSYSFFFYLYR